MHEKVEPILLSKIINNLNFATAGHTPAGNRYSYSTSDLNDMREGFVKGMYAITLPFESKVHIVGIPKTGTSRISRSDVSAGMSSIQLEGDYNNYFEIFSNGINESEVRYLLDPEAMAYSADYLHRSYWEIVDGTLYLLDDGVLPSLEVVDAFIDNIKPANTGKSIYQLTIMKTKEKFHHYAGTLRCPLCDSKLSKGKNWLACEAGHGYLLTGSQLINTRIDSSSSAKQLAAALGRTPKVYTAVSEMHHAEITCPNCKQSMHARDYQKTDVSIDVCTNCPYRWIDGAELNSVLGSYRHE